jgi:hypothetical protein
MKYHILKNYIDFQICDELASWIVENKNMPFFEDANMDGKRLTTRYSSEFEFPLIAYDIQSKIIETLHLKDFSLVNFKNGMVADFADKGDTCYKHTDRVWKEGTITLHCNIKLSDCKGGEPFIDEEELILEKSDLLIYPVSIVEHGSKIVTGNIPRMIWTFGFSITIEDYTRIFNKKTFNDKIFE